VAFTAGQRVPTLCSAYRCLGWAHSRRRVPGDGCARGGHGGVRERTRRAELCGIAALADSTGPAL